MFTERSGIELVDGERLAELVRSVRLAAETRTASSSQPAPLPAPPPVSTGAPPACPGYQSPMVRRVAKHGPSDGQPFWGCPGYPRCRGTRPA